MEAPHFGKGMGITNRISLVLATFALLIIAVLVFGGTVFDLYPDQCKEIKELANREEVVEHLRVDLAKFVNSREGRAALLSMSGLTRRSERLPRAFDALISNLDINRDKAQLVREVDHADRSGSGLDAATAIGIGYSRARLLFPITIRTESGGNLDLIELSKDPYIVCDDD